LQSIRKLNRKQDFRSLLARITSKDFKEKFSDLIKQEFIGEYDGELIDSVLNELNIEITTKNKARNANHDQIIEIKPNKKISNDTDLAKELSSNNRDYSKYFFKGQTFGKNRLVLEVLKDYVENNPSTTYSQLKAIFPDSLQGRETFTTEIEAKQKRDRRNFIKPNEVIPLIDATIAVSTQWSLGNITRFIDHCNQMNIDIQVVR
jgi:hypothetical protein